MCYNLRHAYALTVTFAVLLSVSIFAQAPAQVPAERGTRRRAAECSRSSRSAGALRRRGRRRSIVRVTSDCVILVDGKLPGEQNYNALMEQIRSVTDKPVKFMIVTHHHADHTGNNDRFLAAGVQIVANQNLNKNLETYQVNPRPAMASITYDKDYVVRLGGVAVEAHHFGRSHTSGDTIVYYPDLKVVALSDALTTGGQGPLVDYAGGGSALEWKQVFNALLKLDFDAAIPGNGPVLTKADVQAFKTKFDTVVDRPD
jgi:glyoxylase-like metal-dependent hydrolase (beta-lactamase superfamily II)